MGWIFPPASCEISSRPPKTSIFSRLRREFPPISSGPSARENFLRVPSSRRPIKKTMDQPYSESQIHSLRTVTVTAIVFFLIQAENISTLSRGLRNFHSKKSQSCFCIFGRFRQFYFFDFTKFLEFFEKNEKTFQKKMKSSISKISTRQLDSLDSGKKTIERSLALP